MEHPFNSLFEIIIFLLTLGFFSFIAGLLFFYIVRFSLRFLHIVFSFLPTQNFKRKRRIYLREVNNGI